jgi:hypothetical protein
MADAAPMTRSLFAGFRVGQPRCPMRLQTLCGAWKAALHIALGAMNVVSKHVPSCSVSLCLDGHWFLRL